MTKVLIIAVMSAGFCGLFANELFPSPTIQVSDSSRVSTKSDIGVVPGAWSCGGSGRFIQWRYETCQRRDERCRIPADGSINRAEVDFIPSTNITALGLRLKVHSWDGKIKQTYTYPRPVEFGGTLRAGQTYTISNAGGVSESLRGKIANFHYILFDRDTNDVEVCAEAEFAYW